MTYYYDNGTERLSYLNNLTTSPPLYIVPTPLHSFREDVISKVQQVAEGVINLNEKLDRRIDGLDRKIEEKRQDLIAAMKFSYAELDLKFFSDIHDFKDH